MNGADDDASGTGVLLEIAERFATGAAPRRSIIFISHAAEEAGLVGSQYFTANPTVPLDSIVAAHNMDMLGNGGVADVRFGGPAQVQMLGARRLSAEFGDMIEFGILDPTKVTRTALQNAASIAGLMITTEAMVAEAPKKEEPHNHGGGGGGMGGMGGMDF